MNVVLSFFFKIADRVLSFRSDVVNSAKPKRPTKSTSDPIDLTKSSTPRQLSKPAQVANPTKPSSIKPLGSTKSSPPSKPLGPKRGKGTKRIQADETEDSQATLKKRVWDRYA